MKKPSEFWSYQIIKSLFPLIYSVEIIAFIVGTIAIAKGVVKDNSMLVAMGAVLWSGETGLRVIREKYEE